MQKKSFLNELFDQDAIREAQTVRSRNVNKFIQCFNIAGNNKCRQIRILQVGNPGVISISKKPFLTTQPIKKPQMGLFNNQVLFSGNGVQKIPMIQAQSSRTAYLFSNSSANYKGQSRTISPDKNLFMLNTEYVAFDSSPRKIKGWLGRKKKVEDLPKHFYRRGSQNANIGDNELQIDDNVSKSVNLLSKIKIVEQCTFLNYQNKSGAVIQHRTKPKTDSNRKTPQDIAQQQRKLKLQMKKQINQDYAKPFNPPTNITAASYIIFQPKFSQNKGRRKKYHVQPESSNDLLKDSKKKYPHSHKVLASFNSRNAVEIASLTKIMTCVVALQICKRYGLNSKQQKILVGKFQSNIGGTSAQICQGQTYTLQDLYYGLMLPSGNDASVAIAVWGGRQLLSHEQNDNLQTRKKKQFYHRFILEMNNKAKQLGMFKTNYANSHGLCNPQNRSCAFDLAILCEYAMEIPKFRQIVSCKIYRNTIEYYATQSSMMITSKKSIKDFMKDKDKDDQIQEGEEKDLDSNQQEHQQTLLPETVIAQKTVEWENTHRLVQQKSKQYIGIKTGITTAAGPCLASCVKGSNGRCFIIIVLNCDKLSMRFKDTENLKKWIYQRQNMGPPTKKKSREENGNSPGNQSQNGVIIND